MARGTVMERSLTRAAALSAGLLGWLGMQWMTVKVFEHSHLTPTGSVTHHHPYAHSVVLVASALLAASLLALALTGPARRRDDGPSPRPGDSPGRGRRPSAPVAHVVLAIAGFVAAEMLERGSAARLDTSAVLVALGAFAQGAGASAGWWLGALLARSTLGALVDMPPPWVAGIPDTLPTRREARLLSATTVSPRTSRGPPPVGSRPHQFVRSSDRLLLIPAHAQPPGHV